MKKSLLFVVLIISALFLNSCGVMFGGSKYLGNIKVTDHPNAEIYANGKKIGNGEATREFQRDWNLKVEVKQKGCEPKTQEFKRKFRTPIFILSAFTLGIIGAGIDLGTGAAYKPDRRNPSVEKVSDTEYTFNIDYSECKL